MNNQHYSALDRHAVLTSSNDSFPWFASQMLALRKLILDTARATEGVGALEEALKWGQVSYLTSQSKSGSTVRIDGVKSAEGQVAVYFHCQTNLVETFREFYPELRYGGNRSILLNAEEKLPKPRCATAWRWR